MIRIDSGGSSRTVALWVLAGSLAAAAIVSTPAQAQDDPLNILSMIPVSDGDPGTNEMGWEDSSINATAFKNESLQTAGGFQFVTYYGEDAKLRVARRDVNSTTWDIRATEFTSNNINDGHNVSVLGVDGDGFLHLSWGMHGNNLLYTKSIAPVTNSNPMSFVGDTVGNSAAINTMTGALETSVTYPNFLPMPNGDLLFNYRTGGSGDGDYHIIRYHNATNTWAAVKRPWIENEDYLGAPVDYNAYPQNIVLDSGGGLHASWTFRYNSDSPAGESGYQTNHNLMYGFSPDDGVTWYRDVGGTIPYAGPINDSTSEVIVPIPEGHSLINTGTMAVDSENRPAIATWWAPDAGQGDHRRQYMFVWYDGAEWNTSRITHRTIDSPTYKVPESQLGSSHMGRPEVVFDDDGRALVIYKDNDVFNGITVAYSEAATRDDWVLLDLTTENMGSTEPNIDLARWQQEGILSIYYQPVGQSSGSGSPVSVVEWDVRSFFDRPQNSVTWTGSSGNPTLWDSQVTQNWANPAAAFFQHRDHVTFDDSSTQHDVDISTGVIAGAVSVDTANMYTLSGGKILKSESLQVTGGGNVVLANDGTTVAGPTIVAAGSMLQFGNGASSGQHRLRGPVSGGGELRVQSGKVTVNDNPIAVSQTNLAGGTLELVGTATLASPSINVATGATLDASGLDGGPTLSLGAGQMLTGHGQVIGNVNAGSGSTVSVDATPAAAVNLVIALEAEDMNFGTDWAVFDLASHQAGGGSFDGSGLSGQAIINTDHHSSGQSAPSEGIVWADVEVPVNGTYFLYGRAVVPSNSGIPNPPDLNPTGYGNDSLFTSGNANELAIVGSNSVIGANNMIGGAAGSPDVAQWYVISTGATALEGVRTPGVRNAPNFTLTAGPDVFSIGGREVGFIADAFVLTTTNLTAAELDAALSGTFGTPGSLAIDGDFVIEDGAMLQIELQSTTMHGGLDVAGLAHLDGTLDVSLSDEFVPQWNDQFTIISAGDVDDQFGTLTLPELPGGLTFKVDYRPDSVILSVELAGDYSGDGVVDAADYTIWRDGLGTIYTLADYDAWKTHFGNTAASGASPFAAVPEPAAWLLLLLGSAALSMVSRGAHQPAAERRQRGGQSPMLFKRPTQQRMPRRRMAARQAVATTSNSDEVGSGMATVASDPLPAVSPKCVFHTA